jgi:hypothetical protein
MSSASRTTREHKPPESNKSVFAKHLELLMATVPGITRVALLLAAVDPFKGFP